MTTLKQYISLLIPTLALLVSIHIYKYIDKLVTQYKDSVNQNYSIVIISKEALKQQEISNQVNNVLTLKEMPIEGSLAQFKDILSQENFNSLSSNIPYFYQLKLSDFPDVAALQKIKNNLLRDKNIIKVETFLKKHSSFSITFINIQKIITFFTIITFILSTSLIVKIIEVWYFQHKNRLDIMKLFGASLFQRSQALLKISLINAIISTVVTVSVFYFLYNSHRAIQFLASIGLPKVGFDVISELMLSFGISFGISCIILVLLLIKNK